MNESNSHCKLTPEKKEFCTSFISNIKNIFDGRVKNCYYDRKDSAFISCFMNELIVGCILYNLRWLMKYFVKLSNQFTICHFYNNSLFITLWLLLLFYWKELPTEVSLMENTALHISFVKYFYLQLIVLFHLITLVFM